MPLLSNPATLLVLKTKYLNGVLLICVERYGLLLLLLINTILSFQIIIQILLQEVNRINLPLLQFQENFAISFGQFSKQTNLISPKLNNYLYCESVDSTGFLSCKNLIKKYFLISMFFRLTFHSWSFNSLRICFPLSS